MPCKQDPYQDLTEFALAEDPNELDQQADGATPLGPQVEQDPYQDLTEIALAEDQNEFDQQADGATPLGPQMFSFSEEDSLPGAQEVCPPASKRANPKVWINEVETTVDSISEVCASRETMRAWASTFSRSGRRLLSCNSRHVNHAAARIRVQMNQRWHSKRMLIAKSIRPWRRNRARRVGGCRVKQA